MNIQPTLTEANFNEYIKELSELVSSDIHKRIINSYQISNPVDAMEKELGKILLEVLANED